MRIPDFSQVAFAPVGSPAPAETQEWLTPEGVAVKSFYTP